MYEDVAGEILWTDVQSSESYAGSLKAVQIHEARAKAKFGNFSTLSSRELTCRFLLDAICLHYRVLHDGVVGLGQVREVRN